MYETANKHKEPKKFCRSDDNNQITVHTFNYYFFSVYKNLIMQNSESAYF